MATISVSSPHSIALRKLLSEVMTSDGTADLDRCLSIRAAQDKIRELKLILSSMGDSSKHLIHELEQDLNLKRTDSRRVLLEGIASYCKMALGFIEVGLNSSTKNALVPLPVIDKLTTVMPTLGESIQRRWVEAQKNQHNGCYLSSVIMMGSILEALLLCRASLAMEIANRSPKAPKHKDGRAVAMPEWNLHSLIEVAVDVGWLKVDRGKFSHALRESRNIVHPWTEVASQADFDEDTCKTCWHVLTASINDLIRSLP